MPEDAGMRHAFFFSFVLLLALAPGCSSSPSSSTDTGTGAGDSGALDTGSSPDTGSAPDTGTTPDTGAVADSGSVSDTGPMAMDGGAAPVTFCTETGGGCNGTDTCQTSLCSPPSGPTGFCTPAGRPTCGGFGGGGCPPGVYSVCLGQGPCVADAPGICVTPEERTQICAMQPTLWSCG
jgi:hypothetical protein